MVTEKVYAFIDESGNTAMTLDKEGTSSHYIIAAVIIKESKIENLQNEIESLKIKHNFQQSEIKSSQIGNNHERRKRILSDLMHIDFSYYALIVDKKLIYTDSGLVYKKTFVKYLNEMLFKELHTSYPNIKIIADKQGTDDFIEEFKKYVRARHKVTLLDFETSDTVDFNFSLIDSKDNVLIQLADLLCGTISYGYEESKKSDEYSKFMRYLKDKEIARRFWPEEYKQYIEGIKNDKSNKYDSVVFENSIRLANKYIQDNMNEIDMATKERIFIIKYLKTQLRVKGANAFINTDELIENLEKYTNRKVTQRQFRARVIGKLRDQNVLISSSRNGYKIPVCVSDLYYYADHANNTIIPMFNRLDKARKRIKAATNNELDILSQDKYEKIRRFLDEVNQ